MARLMAVWQKLRASYWFVPALMMVLMLIVVNRAVGMREADLPRWAGADLWLYAGGPEGARAVLTSIAASVVTVAGTTFSVTIAALSLASQQFGPRLLRNFTRDTRNQAVLGTFTATFLYCILVLRSVHSEPQPSVPRIAVSLGLLLALISVVVLIFYIHHSARSIQVAHVIEVAGRELDGSLQKVFPDGVGNQVPPRALPSEPPARLIADQVGYIEELDEKPCSR